MVCVEMTAFFFSATANRMPGMRYARDLPTPVPASTARYSRFCKARATAMAISCCWGRYSKLLALERMPLGEKISSTRETRSPDGWSSDSEIILGRGQNTGSGHPYAKRKRKKYGSALGPPPDTTLCDGGNAARCLY